MRRWLALLLLCSLLAGHAAALACPASHHRAQASHESHDHDAPAPSHERSQPDECVMMSSCGVVSPAGVTGHSVQLATSHFAQLVLPSLNYAAPTLTLPTPPPKSA